MPLSHTNIPPLSFLQVGYPSCRPTNSVKALKAKHSTSHLNNKTYPQTPDLHWHQYLHLSVLYQLLDSHNLYMLPFIPLHFLCTHFWQLVRCIELLPTPLPQIPHVTSSITWPFDTAHAISYRCLVVTKSLSRAVLKIMGLKDTGVTTLTFQGHVTSSMTSSFDPP